MKHNQALIVIISQLNSKINMSGRAASPEITLLSGFTAGIRVAGRFSLDWHGIFPNFPKRVIFLPEQTIFDFPARLEDRRTNAGTVWSGSSGQAPAPQGAAFFRIAIMGTRSIKTPNRCGGGDKAWRSLCHRLF